MITAYAKLRAFVQKHPFKTGSLLVLQVLWLIIAIFALVAYMPGISEDIAAYNSILTESGVEDIDTLGRIAGREGEVLALKQQLDAQIMRMLLIILGTWGIMNAFFFGIVLNRLTLGFVAKALLIQAGAQALLFFVFGTLVDIRTTIGYDKGFWSLIVFVGIWLIIHLLAWMAIAKRKNTPYTNILKRWSVWGIYAAGHSGFFLGVVLTHLPILHGWFGGLITSFLLLFVTVLYGTACKIATVLLIDGTRG